jgi:hypothetical protein
MAEAFTPLDLIRSSMELKNHGPIRDVYKDVVSVIYSLAMQEKNPAISKKLIGYSMKSGDKQRGIGITVWGAMIRHHLRIKESLRFTSYLVFEANTVRLPWF